MADGRISPRTDGTPQVRPLRPLPSNILLTELNTELERWGNAFCQYPPCVRIAVDTKMLDHFVVR